MKLAFIGIGNVGYAIANNLEKKGHQIIVANNNPESETVKKAIKNNPGFVVKNVQDAINESDLVFLATPFQANEAVLKNVKFNNKTLIDCTNPVGPGILHGLNNVKSGSELVQELAPDAKVVKAFNIYGYENFIDSSFPEYNVKPVMLYCGDDQAAKKQTAGIIEEMGFFAKDTGNLTMALHLEHMTLLWVKMVRLNGHNPGFTWAFLQK